MSDQLRIDYRPRPDVSPEQEAEILASIYRFLLERRAEKAADDSRLEPEGGADEALRTRTQGDR
jgi:hypothetical protein